MTSGGASKTACYYCEEECDTLESLGEHLVGAHAEGPVNLRRNGDVGLKPFKKDTTRILQPAAQPVKIKSPFPHQEEALNEITREFRHHDRATAVMASGSGKTLVGLWSALRLGSKRTLVLLPSLALLRQTLLEWRAHGGAEGYIAICSDRTVSELDGIQVSEDDLGCPVSTSPVDVKARITEYKNKRLAIFCTYQSGDVLEQAIPPGFTFDLMILDEAHKTCGQKDALFTLALTDKRIRADKRLFMTATPRVIRKQERQRKVFSMDDPVTYGRHAYILTLDDAIERGIVSEYKVVVPILDNKSLALEMGCRSSVTSGKERRHTKEAVYYLALSKAIKHTGASQIITFHSSVSEAKSFSESTWWSSGALPTHVSTFHVNGKMSTGAREEIIERFKEAKHGVISNARCLLEGVDIPAVDMVAFMSPKKSRLDTTQAIGRALRKKKGKRFGYVMVPSVLDREGNIVLASKEYCDIVDVIRSLKGQDPMFEKELRKAAFHSGSGTKVDVTLGGRVEFIGKDIAIDTLQKALSTRLVSMEGASWDTMFGKLVLWKRKCGDADPSGVKAEWSLLVWATAQRRKKHSGILPERQFTLLESVGFPWELGESRWKVMFAKLKRFHGSQGHSDVPLDYREDHQLSVWTRRQRLEKERGIISKENIRKLESLKFTWSLQDAAWLTNLSELKGFHAETGHSNIPTYWKALYVWLTRQRAKRLSGQLSKSQIEDLDQVGLVWDPVEALWMSSYHQLIEYKELHGHTKVGARARELGPWAAQCRSQHREGRLSPHRVSLLEKVGFLFSFENVWDTKFDRLCKGLSKHDNCWGKLGKSIEGWVGAQRKAKQRGILADRKVKKLESLGICWDIAPKR